MARHDQDDLMAVGGTIAMHFNVISATLAISLQGMVSRDSRRQELDPLIRSVLMQGTNLTFLAR